MPPFPCTIYVKGSPALPCELPLAQYYTVIMRRMVYHAQNLPYISDTISPCNSPQHSHTSQKTPYLGLDLFMYFKTVQPHHKGDLTSS